MKKHEEGQGLVEYALIIVLIALAVAQFSNSSACKPTLLGAYCPLPPKVEEEFDKIGAIVAAWGTARTAQQV